MKENLNRAKKELSPQEELLKIKEEKDNLSKERKEIFSRIRERLGIKEERLGVWEDECTPEENKLIRENAKKNFELETKETKIHLNLLAGKKIESVRIDNDQIILEVEGGAKLSIDHTQINDWEEIPFGNIKFKEK